VPFRSGAHELYLDEGHWLETFAVYIVTSLGLARIVC
jgi:hypothetical protein